MNTTHPPQRKNPFEFLDDNHGYVDYELAVALLPLPSGYERSIMLRLSLDKETGMASASLTYEVEGEHTDIRDEVSLVDFCEITGHKLPKPDLLKTAKDALTVLIDAGGPRQVVSTLRAAIAAAEEETSQISNP